VLIEKVCACISIFGAKACLVSVCHFASFRRIVSTRDVRLRVLPTNSFDLRLNCTKRTYVCDFSAAVAVAGRNSCMSSFKKMLFWKKM
jgi:hypothetical protein